jgi:hypothetical protein
VVVALVNRDDHTVTPMETRRNITEVQAYESKCDSTVSVKRWKTIYDAKCEYRR